MRIVEAMAERLRREMERGRGGDAVQPFPVHIEPPFAPFHHPVPGSARRHPAEPPTISKVKVPPLDALAFLDVKPSPGDRYARETREQMPLALGARYPVALEVIGLNGQVSIQLVATKPDAPHVLGQVRSHYPGAQVVEGADPVSGHRALLSVARGYRLRESHLFQIRCQHLPETYASLVGALANLGEDEMGLFQVLLHPARHPWRQNIVAVATDPWDASKSAFVDLPDLPRKAKSKVESPLFAVAVRLAASSEEVLDRLERGFLSQYQGQDNGLVAVGPTYPLEAVIGRFTRIPGMLLNASELTALAHLPDPGDVAGVPQVAGRQAPAPPAARRDTLVPLGVNRYRGAETPVGIPGSRLPMHVAIFGVPGSGKSNLLTWFLSVVEAGYGLAFLDPAGDTAEWFLRLVPEHRVDDVVYFNPGDREHPPALNALEASDRREKEMLAAELLVSLKRVFHRSGELTPRMERILRQTLRALILSQGERTILDVRRLLREETFRAGVVEGLEEPDLVEFWKSDFPRMPASAVDPILNRLSRFFEDPLVRNVVAQPNLIDFHGVMSEGKILVCNLGKGIIGEDAATLLGSFILSRLQLAAMARADAPEEQRRLFPIIVDELQNYAGAGMDISSIRSFLTEARKMRVPLVLATQYLSQLDREAVAAIFGTVSTFIVLRCGPLDARLLRRELGEFTEEDILNLDTGEALVRMGLARDTFNVQIPLRSVPERGFREQIVRQSRQRYCRPVSEVESLLRRDAAAETKQEQPWIVDGQGNVFTADDLEPDRGLPPEPPIHYPGEEPAEPVAEKTSSRRPVEQDMSDEKGQKPSVSKELIEYLEHAAKHPFMPVAQRNKALSLSKYRSSNIRRQLEEAGWIRQYKVSTGRRSGQLILVEVTERGHEFLSSLRIRVQRPSGRGGFVHRYYAHKLKQYAEATWPECTATIEDSSQGRPADVTVRVLRAKGERKLAFEVFMSGEDKEVRGIVQDLQLFDQVIVCAPDSGSLEGLKARAAQALDAGMLGRVTFSLVSQYLLPETPDGKSVGKPRHSSPQKSSYKHRSKSSKPDEQVLIPGLELEKSGPELELEPERRKPSGRRGRRPRAPLTKQIEDAYTHLHDLDWLQESKLAGLPEVQEHVDPARFMPEARALRELLLEAARQVSQALEDVPDQANVRYFLGEYLKGKSVAQIAKELGVTRSWCSSRYRKEAFQMAGRQFTRLVSSGS